MSTAEVVVGAKTRDDEETVITADVEFHGTLRIKGERKIRVFGVLEGELESAGCVVVAPGGRIGGKISAKQLQVHGVVQSDSTIVVAGLLSVASTGELHGKNVRYADLELQRGGKLLVKGELEAVAEGASLGAGASTTALAPTVAKPAVVRPLAAGGVEPLNFRVVSEDTQDGPAKAPTVESGPATQQSAVSVPASLRA